jgi:hypothetical protein
VGEERKNIILLLGSQASPSRPSYKDSMKVRRLKWFEAVASDKDQAILNFLN